ncbi:MAG: phage holin family protein [Armatimonadota bacterium]|nr:phage holin family protein [Armatimonadota bacterium]
MRQILLRWLLNALGLWVILGILGFFLPGSIRYSGIFTPLIVILVLGLLNAFIRPIFKMFALPLNCLTLGLFGIVINLFFFWLAFRVTPGFEIEGPPRGVIAILIAYAGMTVVSGIVNLVVRKGD